MRWNLRAFCLPCRLLELVIVVIAVLVLAKSGFSIAIQLIPLAYLGAWRLVLSEVFNRLNPMIHTI
jgi:hypothetical protein